jgi:hypothetical protein
MYGNLIRNFVIVGDVLIGRHETFYERKKSVYVLAILRGSSIFYKSCCPKNMTFIHNKSGGLPVLPKLFAITTSLFFLSSDLKNMLKLLC